MSVTRIQTLHCDHRGEPQGAGYLTTPGPDGTDEHIEVKIAQRCRRVFIPDEADLQLRELRQRATNRGWDRYVTSSRHEYDLCPDHNTQRPGIDFPHWKADRAEAAAGVNGAS